jgi:NAD(P)-dependent dehydrogenase (short-subunit alcohol dehydrogenase family)
VIAAFPEAKERVPELRMIVVTGPRIDPASLPAHDGLEVRPYVRELYRHLAVCDLAVVQGGLTTTMELTAARRPFIYFPLGRRRSPARSAAKSTTAPSAPTARPEQRPCSPACSSRTSNHPDLARYIAAPGNPAAAWLRPCPSLAVMSGSTLPGTAAGELDRGKPVKVLVTGGTSGLGLAMASALAAAGAAVALTGRSAPRAAAAAAALPGVTGLQLDVRDELSVARAVDQAWSRLGGIDMLVNNAGIGMRTVNPRFMTHPQGFWEVPPSGFRAVIETNLTGYFLVAREVTPRMLAARGGRIVNISVNQSTMHRAGFVPYGPSRAGSEALSRIMAADLKDTGVTVNLLLPGGATATRMLPDEVPAGRELLAPEVMGRPIVWLASDEAAGVHDERIIAADFERWLSDRHGRRPGAS